MKHAMIQNLKYVLFAGVIALGISAYAAPFANPAGSAPSGNVSAPLHTGPDQIKDGGLSVGTFAAFKNAQFSQQAFFNGTINGVADDDGNSWLNLGDANRLVNASVAGNIGATDYIKSTPLSNDASKILCAKTDGTITLCDQTAAPQASYTIYNQTLVYPYPDYAISPGFPDYYNNQSKGPHVAVCMSGTAKQGTDYVVKWGPLNSRSTRTVTIPLGQNCSPDETGSQTGTGRIVWSAPHTLTSDPVNVCVYKADDKNYLATPYQGVSITVDPAVRCTDN
jgi:hypothetical protein